MGLIGRGRTASAVSAMLCNEASFLPALPSASIPRRTASSSPASARGSASGSMSPCRCAFSRHATKTPGLLGLAPAGQEQALLDAQAAEVPLGRVADPAEIANAAVFLASDQSSFVNGVEFFVDGGQAQI